MWVKIDYSTQDKKNFRTNTEGQYTVYIKKHWWNKWTKIAIYSDFAGCIQDTKRLVEPPKYYHKVEISILYIILASIREIGYDYNICFNFSNQCISSYSTKYIGY